MVLALLIGAAASGLLGSPHCVGMCGAFATACAGDRAGSVAWHLGRLTTYAALGALAGVAGHLIPGPTWLASAVAATLLLWFSASIAGLVRPPHLVIPGLAIVSSRLLGRHGAGWRYALGVCSGLLPCGLVYSALAAPVASASPIVGAAAMVAFGLGTIPALALAATGLRHALAGSPWRRRTMAAAVLVAGLWAVAARAPGSPDAPPCHQGGH